jgi:hypothetical protein
MGAFVTSGKQGGPKTGRMIKQERARARQAIRPNHRRPGGVTLRGLKIKD